LPCGPKTEPGCRKLCAGRFQHYVECNILPFGLVECVCDACPPFKDLPICSKEHEKHIIRGVPHHTWPLPIEKLKKQCFDKIIGSGSGKIKPRSGPSIGFQPCSYEGHCFGKKITIMVGFNPKPCISNAWIN
jgi:hypothetical protein